MKKSLIGLIFLFFSTWTFAFELAPKWQIEGFQNPESVVYDPERNQYYVSNIHGDPFAKDGNGFISLIRGEGESVEHLWVEGLDAPKGLALFKNRLYVADVSELVVIDVRKARIIARYPAPEAIVLNGVAVSSKERVFVSDWLGNKIYTLSKNGMKIWLEDESLDSPNGLFLTKKYLYIAAWGKNPREDFTTETSGGLKRVSLKNKRLEDMATPDQWMNLDGLHRLNKNTWISNDFITGTVFALTSQGEILDQGDIGVSAADFVLVKAKNRIVVPYFFDNKVVSYSLY